MEGGGVEAFVMSYFRELHDKVDFTFMCTDDSKAIPYEEIERLGSHVVLVPYPKNIFKFNKAMSEHLKVNKYDIIHSHINTLSVFPLRMAKKYKIPVRIAHSHSSSSKKEFLRHLAKSFLKLFSKKYANVYFACSESAGRFQFGNKAYDEGKVVMIKNAIDIKKFSYNISYREEVRKSLDIKDSDFVVGTIGRLASAKNHKYIISLAKKAPNFLFLIVGSGNMEEELREEISKQGVQNLHIICPNLPINYYYSAFDIFVMPSLYEGFGLAAIEAEANGLYALLSTNLPKETLITGYGKYLPIEDNDLDLWLEEINKKPKREFRSEMIVRAGYDIHNAADELLEHYKKLVG